MACTLDRLSGSTPGLGSGQRFVSQAPNYGSPSPFNQVNPTVPTYPNSIKPAIQSGINTGGPSVDNSANSAGVGQGSNSPVGDPNSTGGQIAEAVIGLVAGGLGQVVPGLGLASLIADIANVFWANVVTPGSIGMAGLEGLAGLAPNGPVNPSITGAETSASAVQGGIAPTDVSTNYGPTVNPATNVNPTGAGIASGNNSASGQGLASTVVQSKGGAVAGLNGIAVTTGGPGVATGSGTGVTTGIGTNAPGGQAGGANSPGR